MAPLLTKDSAASAILARFGAMLGAQGVEAVLTTGLFLYLAHVDSVYYGQVMYGIAWGSILMKAADFGLYFPLVRKLNHADPAAVPTLLNQANLIRVSLLAAGFAVVTFLAVIRDFSAQMTWVILLMSVGYGLEALSDTFLADYRVNGRQRQEAGLRNVSNLAGFGYGFVAAALRFDPVLISLFKVISSLLRLIIAGRGYIKACLADLAAGVDRRAVAAFFRLSSAFAFIQLAGIIYNKTNIIFMEGAVGVKGVAYYSATWTLLDPISILASTQLLAWVVYPVLNRLWLEDRPEALRLVWGNALWLFVLAFPIMFVLYAESELMIRLLYPPEYKDAIWMQKWLVLTIVLSFLNNLFAYVMMTDGGQKPLLFFSLTTLLVNLALNHFLVSSLGLLGGCLVIILTKLTMTTLTLGYCQMRFKLFTVRDFAFPTALGLGCLAGFHALAPGLGVHIAAFLALAAHGLGVLYGRRRFLGPPLGRYAA